MFGSVQKKLSSVDQMAGKVCVCHPQLQSLGSSSAGNLPQLLPWAVLSGINVRRDPGDIACAWQDRPRAAPVWIVPCPATQRWRNPQRGGGLGRSGSVVVLLPLMAFLPITLPHRSLSLHFIWSLSCGPFEIWKVLQKRVLLVYFFFSLSFVNILLRISLKYD